MSKPKYIELANKLREEVLRGLYGSQGGLPAARDIAKRESISLNTAKTALARLEGERIIVKRNTGYYVNKVPIMMTQYYPQASQAAPNAYCENVGDVEKVMLPAHLADRLGMVPVEVVHRLQLSGKVVDGEKCPERLTRRYYLGISDDKMQQLENPAYDHMWIEFPFSLIIRDEFNCDVASSDEQVWLRQPDGAPVMRGLEAVGMTDKTRLMITETTATSQVTFIFEYEFKNKPEN